MADDRKNPPLDFTQGLPLVDLPPGRVRAGRLGGKTLILWRNGEGISAFSGECPHLGAPLADGLVEGNRLYCPWHHACFDLSSGAVKEAPAFDNLTCYEIKIRDDRIWIGAAIEPRAASSFPARRLAQRPMVIVGGGAAGFAAADALRKERWDGEIVLVTAEQERPYDRTLLTKDYLDGHFGDDRLPIAHHTLTDLDVRLEAGFSVTMIDRGTRALRLNDGRMQPYEKLLLATGGEPKRPNLPGIELRHVHVLRSLADCRSLLAGLKSSPRIAVIGGSFIAMEAAASLRNRGLDVSVISPEPEPMAKVLGKAISDLIVEAHRGRGVRLYLGRKVVGIEQERVRVDDGSAVAANLVLVGAGITPNVEFARQAGLKIENGICVDRYLRTSDPTVFAAGDIARWPDPYSGQEIRVEHWVVAERQGQVAAANMLGRELLYDAIPFFWTKHFDLSIRYVGHAETWDELVIEGDLARRDALVRYRSKGRDLAVATVGRDLQCLQVVRSMQRSVAGHATGASASGKSA